MGKVETIESQIKQLSRDELAKFRARFAEFEAEAWDRKLESDVKAGKLDTLADNALREHRSGQSTKL